MLRPKGDKILLTVVYRSRRRVYVSFLRTRSRLVPGGMLQMSRVDRRVFNATWLPKQDFNRLGIGGLKAHMSTMLSYTSRQLTLSVNVSLFGDMDRQVSMAVMRFGMKLPHRVVAAFEMPM